MKTLVIHPYDQSTDFLIPIYMDLGGFPDFEKPTVIRGGMTREDVDQEIIKHDRIIMLGHGAPGGLFSVGQFPGSNGYIVSHGTADILKDKECVFIWCNADKFVEANNLKGLYSGMFISETSEAAYCGLPGTPQDIVDESNDFFAKEFGRVSAASLNEAYEYVKDVYGILAEDNPVAKYNHHRLYLNS